MIIEYKNIKELGFLTTLNIEGQLKSAGIQFIIKASKDFKK